MDEFDGFLEGSSDVSTSLEATSDVAREFNASMQEMLKTFAQLRGESSALERTFKSSLKQGIDDLVFHGATFSDVISNIKSALSTAVYNKSANALVDELGSSLFNSIGSFLPFADGAPFSQGRVVPFAKGGVVDSPTIFPMRGATGLMGEAGPEAIMPLQRGADGRLGVQASFGGGRPIQVVMNVTTPDAQGFQRSQSQIATRMQRLMARGNRNN